MRGSTICRHLSLKLRLHTNVNHAVWSVLPLPRRYPVTAGLGRSGQLSSVVNFEDMRRFGMNRDPPERVIRGALLVRGFG